MNKASCIVLLLAQLLTAPLYAQTTAPDSQDESLAKFRAMIQARADRGQYPIPGMNPNDAREALARLKRLDKDDWATTWMEQGDKYMTAASAAGSNDRTKARDSYLTAWRLYNFGGWPARDSPGKESLVPEIDRSLPWVCTPAGAGSRTRRNSVRGQDDRGIFALAAASRTTPNADIDRRAGSI